MEINTHGGGADEAEFTCSRSPFRAQRHFSLYAISHPYQAKRCDASTVWTRPGLLTNFCSWLPIFAQVILSVREKISVRVHGPNNRHQSIIAEGKASVDIRI